jgi:hypothetical protein
MLSADLFGLLTIRHRSASAALRSESSMKRREFIALFAGSAIRWPLTAGARQPMPVIGYLGATSRGKDARILGSLREGLKGRHVTTIPRI